MLIHIFVHGIYTLRLAYVTTINFLFVLHRLVTTHQDAYLILEMQLSMTLIS